MESKWSKSNTLAQFIIAGLITITIIFTCNSIDQQKEFNRKTLRPWITVHPDSDYPIEINHDTIIFDYYITCGGYSPAVNVYVGAVWNTRDTFPYDVFNLKALLPIVMLPQDTMWVNRKKQNLISSVDINDKIILALLENNKFFAHFFAFYEDLDGNRYNYKATWHGKNFVNNRMTTWTGINIKFDDDKLKKYHPHTY